MKGEWTPRRASEIAGYVVDYVNNSRRTITHLKLQKILYYLQGHVAAECDGTRLFTDEIEAWRYGPVVSNVYYEYCPNGSLPIRSRDVPALDIDEDVLLCIHDVIEKKMQLTESQLVSATHREDPWKMHAEEVENGKKPIIRFEEIKKYFVQQAV